MAAGNIIYKFNGYQDVRRTGGSVTPITLESIILLISLSCLGGLPFLLGFFNKHYLLLNHSENALLVAQLATQISAITGLFYTQKTVKNLFCSIKKKNRSYDVLWGFSTGASTITGTKPFTGTLSLLSYACIITLMS